MERLVLLVFSRYGTFCVFLYLKGPLTRTDDRDETTVYGIVASAGTTEADACKSRVIFTKVSAPKILNWIKEVIGKLTLSEPLHF